jgi:hypothetical protein
MGFKKLIDHIDQPRTVYDGGEVERVTIPLPEPGFRERDLVIDLGAPEGRAWRHYYTDGELNHLKDELRFDFKFVMNREAAFNGAIGRLIYLLPVYKYDAEYTVCFSYTEMNYGRYVFWLVAILKRGVGREVFDERVAAIKKYWLPDGS